MDVVMRAAVMYIVVVLLLRAMGRRELAEMSSFELIVLVVMGDLIQQGVTQEDYSITGAVLAIGTMGLLSLLVSYLGFLWPKVDEIVEGAPALVLRDGELVDPVLRANRVTKDDVLASAREQGIGDLNEVEFAVLEPDGEFSFVRFNRAPSRAKRHKAE
ncbi:MAG TPA: YetF domain-containing protein [Actinomycetota bacterium]|nr:YetF domain-containing protein [Actinomycetota bacterium]